MLYDLTLALELADGTSTTWRQAVGLRRWEIHGRDLFRGGKRTVLRGAFADDCSSAVLAQADDAEVTLVVRDPSDEVLQCASELGVMLVADLRGFEREVAPVFLRYALHPSVILVLLDDDNSCAYYMPYAMRLGSVCGTAKPQAADVECVDVFLFELEPGERPPAWVATCAKPVIAIRRGGAYPELSAARRGCDRLQAALAPEFDLAGYFV